MRYLFYIALILSTTYFYNTTYAQVEITQQEQEMLLQPLSPEQQRALETELQKTGGVLTPSAIESLKNIPGFEGLTQEDIVKGKKILDAKEREEKEVLEKIEKIEKEEKVEKEEKEPLVKIEREKSLFDRYRAFGLYQDISTDLRPFGYEFFAETDLKLLRPRHDIPVSPDYVIGPGDEVKILLWGRVNAQYSLTVDRDGNITIPQIGPLQVNGMRFDEMKDFLAQQAEQIVGANMSVTMGDLKSIQVFVLGEVRKPGSYALDSFSTITGALLAAGGPTEIGSLRTMQLKRKNRTIVVMDFYDFLLKGDQSQDVVLQSGDVVFIPTAGPLVGIAGNVKRPAVYELKKKYDLLSLIDMAGGVIPTAYTQQIQVERIQKNERQIVIDINDRDLVKSKDFMLHDGDLVKIFPIVDMAENVVFLIGNVKRPGQYEFKPGMRVKNLIKDPSDLLKETYFEYALIKRLKQPTRETELIPFHLGRLLLENDADSNILLEPEDSVYVFSKWLFKDKPSITVEGEVREEGTFMLMNNYRVKDAILEAGGLTRDASYGKGEIFRTTEEGKILQMYFTVGLAMAEDSEENILLQDQDRITIHSIWEEKGRHTVSIDGEVKTPGQYPLAQNMHVSDLIFAAGNILDSAYMEEAEISLFIIEDGRSVRIDHRKINLRLALNDDPEHNIVLQPYNRVFVKRIPDWQEERFVSVEGEVKFPGRYIIKKGETLSSVLERAGGYTNNAYLRGAVFTRESVQKLQQKSIEEMISRLEVQLLAAGSAEASAALSAEEVASQKVELEQKEKFIEKLKELRATGRMSIRLSHLRLLKNSLYDITLENNDALMIPEKNSVVTVLGGVMSQGSLIYSEGRDHEYYIARSGGYSRLADKKQTYVLKVDGSANRLSRGKVNWNDSSSRWEVSGFGEEIRAIEPGDTIVVPERLERYPWMREVKDFTQILYQIAVTAGVLIVAF